MKDFRVAAVIPLLLLTVSSLVMADPPKKEQLSLPPAVSKPLPESLDDLKAIQAQTKKVLDKVIPCTVGVQIGDSSGSGVIVSKDGYVLTAGHVSGKPGQKCTIIFPDGKRIAAKSLGREDRVDSGLFKITEEGEWPFVQMGKSVDLKLGQWCIAVGHPNGFQKGRTPVVRVGRVLFKGSDAIHTDCTLVGGDSGGPLFDMEGKVIAIHSRIGPTISNNVHVPVDQFTSKWNRLVKGDDIVPVNSRQTASGAYLGVIQDDEAKECKLASVTEGSPAEKAGLKTGDVITRFDGKEVKDFDDLLDLLRKKTPGDEVEVVVRRGAESKNLKVKLVTR